MKICFLYGGQGSQQMGMGKDFYENFPTFQKFYDSIDIDFDLKEYSFNKSNEEISQTRYTQPLMIAFQIGITKLLAEKNIKPDITGGLSIGEYSCLYASNILTDKDAMKIAQKRGIAMTNSTDIPCKMVAIIGYDENEIKNICSKVSSENKYPVEISNLNCPSQVVIAGEKNSVDKVIKILKENNVKLIELSNILNISRPTLNSYIDEFEKEGKITNEEYDSFFKKISKKSYLSREELFGDINEFKEFLMKKKYGDFLPENLRLLQSIYRKIYKDMKGKNKVVAIYKFLESAINNYGEDKALSGYINYTLYLNGLKDIKEITADDKILVSNIFPIMKKYEKSELEINDEGLKEFYSRVDEIKKVREIRYQKFERELKEKLMKELSLKDELNKEDLKRVLNNLDLKKI